MRGKFSLSNLKELVRLYRVYQEIVPSIEIKLLLEFECMMDALVGYYVHLLNSFVAPSQHLIAVRDRLDYVFGNQRVMGLGGDVEWPPATT